MKLPLKLVRVRTGNRKHSIAITKALNESPKFREAMQRIGRRVGKLTASQAKARGLPVTPKANRAKINKLFGGVKPYDH